MYTDGHAAYVGLLQWGHDLSVMDTGQPPNPRSIGRSRFNGAMTFRSWILVRPKSSGIRFSSFNGAMTFRSWIPDGYDPHLFVPAKASMGP